MNAFCILWNANAVLAWLEWVNHRIIIFTAVSYGHYHGHYNSQRHNYIIRSTHKTSCCSLLLRSNHSFTLTFSCAICIWRQKQNRFTFRLKSRFHHFYGLSLCLAIQLNVSSKTFVVPFPTPNSSPARSRNGTKTKSNEINFLWVRERNEMSWSKWQLTMTMIVMWCDMTWVSFFRLFELELNFQLNWWWVRS